MLDSLVRVSRRVLRVPKAVASPTGIGLSPPKERERDVRRPVEGEPYFNQQRARTGDGAKSVTSEYRGARLRRPRRTVNKCGLIPCAYRRAAGRATGGLSRAVLPATRQSPHPGRRPTPSGSRRSTWGEVHDDERRTSTHGSVPAREPRGLRGTSPTDAKPAPLTMNLPVRSFGFLRFTPERFHVLLNSLFKVLFNFPSRYLFAIGLVVVFSLRWSLPPT